MGLLLPLLSRSAPPVEPPLARLDTACDFRVLVVVVQQPLVGGQTLFLEGELTVAAAQRLRDALARAPHRARGVTVNGLALSQAGQPLSPGRVVRWGLSDEQAGRLLPTLVSRPCAHPAMEVPGRLADGPALRF